MLAVGMLRGKEGVHSFDVPVPEIKQPDEVLVGVKQVGLDGTDFNMLRHQLQDPAEGRDEVVMGHEMVGVVEETGSAVTSLAPGDVAVMTVRRGCGICHPCLHNQSDMCMTGLYTERGIHRLDGFLTRFVADREQYILKVPPRLRDLAVFSEPLSIVEKGIEQIKLIQSRLPWTCSHPEHDFQSGDWGGCKTALVVGAGPLGLLATALLRFAGTKTYVADIVSEDSPKVHMVRHMDAIYIDARDRTPAEIVGRCFQAGGLIDIIFEAAGAVATAIELINYMSRSSIYVMTGIPRKEMMLQVDGAQLVRQLVRYNQVIVGSVNSNRSHFQMALDDIGEVDARFDGMLGEMVTNRFQLENYEQAFILDDPNHIKTVIDVEPWD